MESREILPEKWYGGYELPKTLTLFMTKLSDFPYLFMT